MVRMGVTNSAARTRGTARKRKGSRPMVVRALTSSLTFMVPISAAKAAPERPASKMAVTRGPSSRSMEMPSMSGMKMSAPKRLSGMADWKAMIRPMRKPIRPMMGMALTPAVSQVDQTSFQRTRPGLAMARPRATLDSPRKPTRSLTSRHMRTPKRPTCSR